MVPQHSALYRGEVFHQRRHPKLHQFRYPLTLLYVDVDEIDAVLKLHPFASRNRCSLLRFRRADFHGHSSESIKSAVYKTVRDQADIVLKGPVRVLAHWRCFGFNFNPLTTYYCFDEGGEKLVAIVAEVTNTPWLERHPYVLRVNTDGSVCTQFDKGMTVSPFHPLDMTYHWKSNVPADHLNICIANEWRGETVFQARLALRAEPLSRHALNQYLFSLSGNPLRGVMAIYWQAARLMAKRIPFLGKAQRPASEA